MTATPAAVEDDETKAAFVAFFQRDPDATAACPGGLTTGKVVSGVKPGTVQTTTPSPYANIECEQGPGENAWNTGGGYIDWRKVTIMVYGPRAALIPAAGHFRRLFDGQMKGVTMTLPQGSTGTLKLVWPLPGSGTMVQSKERVNGESRWEAKFIYRVMTNRTKP